ncbi:curli-like amyloid fiber formation chaperone CsgH [Roseicyclus mahoneyensis]|uniref:CsgH-like domain-containing protein n=1 Tax=Roseicyclus mahoneyensis TaxID=164332 RepID=A0A316GXF7_9RHOB|nr:curli-like amyloid fiber formation chaperone CsgH [Roseicyclus mahoneyensis]PWK59773.1 hypothetical protein C7455_10659 [Roseicyclus mahoneyensis]
MTFVTPKMALGTALTALALGCTAIAADTAGTASGPLACTVDVTSRGGMLTVEGVVTTTEALSGSYHLRVARGGMLMNQGGPFALRPGETERLGRVTMNGPASGLEIDLTLDADGRTIRCPVDL